MQEMRACLLSVATAFFLIGCTSPGSTFREASGVFSGVYRQGFEQSDFYTAAGAGPYWLDAEPEAWSRLMSYRNDAPGRASAVIVRLTVEGELRPHHDDPLGRPYSGHLHVSRIIEIEAIPAERFDQAAAGAGPGTG